MISFRIIIYSSHPVGCSFYKRLHTQLDNSVTMASTTAPPASGEETLVQHLIRSTKNCWTACVGGVQQSDELARIQYKEYEIRSRKQKFGIEYIDLVRKEATAEELKTCLDVALKSMETTEAEIAELQKEVDRVNTVTKAKLLAKPGAPTAASNTPAAASAPVVASEPTPESVTVTKPTAPEPAPETAMESISPDTPETVPESTASSPPVSVET